jgi:hypothetical protein
MTRTAAFILGIFFCVSLSGQKKKELKKNRIRCIATTETLGARTINDSKEFFNADGELITAINYDKEGNLKSKTQYKYVNGNDLSQEIQYDAHNVIVEKKTYSYNGLGEKTGEVIKDKNNKVLKRMEYLYNANGLKSERRTYDAANKLVSVKKYDYNCK